MCILTFQLVRFAGQRLFLIYPSNSGNSSYTLLFVKKIHPARAQITAGENATNEKPAIDALIPGQINFCNFLLD
jgi:hypothetical protein